MASKHPCVVDVASGQRHGTSASQRRFIRSEILHLSIAGAFGRAKIYAATAESDAARQVVRDALMDSLVELGAAYEKTVNEAAHIDNIERLAKAMTDRCKPLLHAGHFRIGVAQKALNLYLKYLWCLGVIPEPPHCPIDAIVLQRAHFSGIPWTQMDDMGDYRECVAAVRKVAGEGRSIARWECEAWNLAAHAV